jgi:hypothetical protein
MLRKSSHPNDIAKARATMDEILDARTRLNQTSADFMRVDVATALTFCQIARDTEDPDKKARNREHARRGYDTVMSLMKKVHLTEAEHQDMAANLEKLRSELENLGDVA